MNLLLVLAAALSTTVAVQTQPSPAAPAVGYLKAGANPESAGPAPDGWMAINWPGPFTAWVPKSALDKGLDVKPGSSLYLEPRTDAGVLATAASGDKIQITGLRGAWVQIKLDRPLLAYVQVSAPPAAAQPAPGTVTEVPPPPPPSSAPGHAAEGPATPGPQLFEGRFASAHHWYNPSRSYDWQLLAPGGSRIGFLDVTRLLLTEHLDNYVGHNVAVYGIVSAVPGSKDIVIAVENLQLR